MRAAIISIIIIITISFTACTRQTNTHADGDLSIIGEWRYVVSRSNASGDVYEEERLTYPTTSALSIDADLIFYAGMYVYYGTLKKIDPSIYNFNVNSMREIVDDYLTEINMIFVFSYDSNTESLAWDDQEMNLIRYYERADAPPRTYSTNETSDIINDETSILGLTKQTFDKIMRQDSRNIFFIEENIPFNLYDYSIKEDVIQRSFEGDPDAYEYTLYIVQNNGHDIMNIFGEEIIVISDIVKTAKNIGVNSTIEEFANAYPDFGIYYTYVSTKYWLSTEQYPNIQFLLDGSDFLSQWDGSTIMELKAADFKPNSRIGKIRIFGNEMLFLH